MSYDNWCAECGNKLIQLDDNLRCIPCEIREIDLADIREAEPMAHVVVGITVSHTHKDCPDSTQCKWKSEFIRLNPELVKGYAQEFNRPLSVIRELIEEYLQNSLALLSD